MSNMVYHKQVVKRHNTLASKERYQRKRERRKLSKLNLPTPEQISYRIQRQLEMQMNPKDYRDYLAIQEKKSHKITSIPELVPEIKKELIKPITKLNWFEKLVMWIRKLFDKKK